MKDWLIEVSKINTYFHLVSNKNDRGTGVPVIAKHEGTDWSVIL